MAISIIKKGKVRHSVYKAECDICGCVFEFEKQDAEVRNSHDLENSYFIGDTTHDAEVGSECGLKVILIDRGHQAEDVLAVTKNPILHSFDETIEFIKNS